MVPYNGTPFGRDHFVTPLQLSHDALQSLAKMRLSHLSPDNVHVDSATAHAFPKRLHGRTPSDTLSA